MFRERVFDLKIDVWYVWNWIIFFVIYLYFIVMEF
jgi:hypothetical protein